MPFDDLSHTTPDNPHGWGRIKWGEFPAIGQTVWAWACSDGVKKAVFHGEEQPWTDPASGEVLKRTFYNPFSKETKLVDDCPAYWLPLHLSSLPPAPPQVWRPHDASKEVPESDEWVRARQVGHDNSIEVRFDHDTCQWFDVDGNPQTGIVCWETFGEFEALFDIGT